MTLLPNRHYTRILATCALLFAASVMAENRGIARMQTDLSDKDKLGMALDYFQSGKFHEAMLLFVKLDRQYQLNPRFKAYIGTCFYYEGDYRNASRYFDEAIPGIDAFAPHERSVYYYFAAESMRKNGEYKASIPMYEIMLNVCYDNEKADALFGIGACYDKLGDNETAREYIQSAKAYYDKYNSGMSRKEKMAYIDSILVANN